VAWGDYDNDSDLDLLLTGKPALSKIYRNDGDNTFTEQTEISLIGVAFSSVAWGDYDNDGDLDILLTGYASTYQYVSKIYRNNGNNTFTEQTTISLTGVFYGDVAWGDYDNDGDLDILLTGDTGSLNTDQVTKIYRNNGDNTFTDETGITLASVTCGSVAWGDYDNDSDLDILLTGITSSGVVAKIYRNNNITPNTLPSTPSNLQSVVSGQDVTFSWDKSTDNETPQDGLRYNLVIGTSPNAINTLSPMSDRNTGYRRVINLGNTNHNNSWTIKGLDSSQTYYWSVQAIDNCFAASEFAPEQSLLITSVEGEKFNKLPAEYELNQNFPNPFNPNTTIRFSLPQTTQLKINLYNMLGEQVATLAEGMYEAGYHKVVFNTSSLPSGTYIYRLESNDFVQVKKMILLK
jgi:predicted nucleotidyltransferase